MQSEYMHWAKNQPPVRYDLGFERGRRISGSTGLPFTIADLEIDGASHHRYPPLRQAIGKRYGVPPERVVTADGTSMANMLAMAALIEPGDEVLIERPTYEPMLAAARFPRRRHQAVRAATPTMVSGSILRAIDATLTAANPADRSHQSP